MEDEIKKSDAVSWVKLEVGNGNNEKSVNELQEGLSYESTLAFLRAKERKELIEMRGKWSSWVLCLLVFIVGVDTLFVYLVGLNLLKFSNDYIVPTFIGEGLMKTIGLAYIIVNFLFSKDSTETNKEKN